MVSLLKKGINPHVNDGHTDRVLSIVNHPTNPHEFVSSGWDNTLQVIITTYIAINLMTVGFFPVTVLGRQVPTLCQANLGRFRVRGGDQV